MKLLNGLKSPEVKGIAPIASQAFRCTVWFALAIGGASFPIHAQSQDPDHAHSAAAGQFEVVIERRESLPNHTLFRPASQDGELREMPLLVWENGGCRNDPTGYSAFLSRVASAGYLVIAKGYEGNDSAGPDRTVRGREADMLMEEAIAWAAIETARTDGDFYQQIDVSDVGLFGHSCGGFTSLQVAPVDPRVSSVIVFNSSTNPFWSAEDARALIESFPPGFPVAWVNGGVTDIAYANGKRDWEHLPDTMPGLHVEYDFPALDLSGEPSDGHAGFFRGDRADRLNPVIADIAIKWFDYTAVSGSEEAGEYLFAQPCGFCGDELWDLESRNWSAFAGPAQP